MEDSCIHYEEAELFLINGHWTDTNNCYGQSPTGVYGSARKTIMADASYQYVMYGDDFCCDVLLYRVNGKWGLLLKTRIEGMGCASYQSTNSKPFVYDSIKVIKSGEVGEGEPREHEEAFYADKKGYIAVCKEGKWGIICIYKKSWVPILEKLVVPCQYASTEDAYQQISENQKQLKHMATLKELYTTLKSLRDMKLPVDDKLLKAADNLEEKIIKEEILPSLSQNIEPLLSEIQRDLVLVVEYHPGEPISVALSRKTKISEIVDAKTLTTPVSKPVSAPALAPVASNGPIKHVENPTKGLRVTFPDGTVIWHKAAIDTFVDALRKIGLDRIPQIGIKHGGYNLVGKDKRPIVPGRVWQHEVDGWYIYCNISNETKISDLQHISNLFHLALKIEEVKPK